MDANDANTGAKWVTVEEAAALLCLSVRTIQKQAAAGKLSSRRAGRRLLVYIDPDAAFANGREVREYDATLPPVGKDGALVGQLQTENAFLRAQLEARTTAEAELRRLLLENERQITGLQDRLDKLLTAAPAQDAAQRDDVDLPEREDSQAGQRQGRRWWEFWRRGA